jgi:FkbM family methyltransferase
MLGKSKSPWCELSPLNRIVTPLVIGWLQKKLTPFNKYWVRPGDSLTAGMLLGGAYEAIEVETIRALARDGFSDFLLDIGANIGIISSETGDFFEQLHAFEPNPTLIPILGSNLQGNLLKTGFHIYPFALGGGDKCGTLNLPLGNTGGGFIREDEQAYSDTTLALKDGFLRFSDDNYLRIPIEIRDTRVVFEELFKSLSKSGLSRGVIKIDVEGFEAYLIQNLILTLPKGFHVHVVFENWSDIDKSKSEPWGNSMAKLFHLKKTHRFQLPNSKIRRIVLFLMFGWQKFSVEKFEVNAPGLGTNILELCNSDS